MPHSGKLLEYRKQTIQDLQRLSFLGQSDDSPEAFDFAVLIALAEDHRLCQVQPHVDGFYTVCRLSTKFWIVLIPYTVLIQYRQE